ncbi:MAG: hypothetical protein J5715_02955 [Clostridiales bacterium]|nr:hypothetical protein [Clostridiales bacterium]
MKVTDINIDQLLYTKPVSGHAYDRDEEGVGLFKKMFAKKEPEIPYFNTRVEQFGRDELYNDIKEGYDAYIVKGAPFETMVVLSKSFLIIPEQEIFPFYDIIRFAIKNPPYGERLFEQYAIDRFDEPYDPTYVSEYENEEGFELDRFNILLEITDENSLIYEYVIPMEVADRKDFRAKFNERMSEIGVVDSSEDEVMEGRFPDDGGYGW